MKPGKKPNSVSFFRAFSSGNSRISIIGVPLKTGTAKTGCENAPYYLRACSKRYTWSASNPFIGIISNSRLYSFCIKDLGDIPGLGNDHISNVQLVERFIDSFPKDEVPVLIGGNHSITYPVVRSLFNRYQNLKVVQFDHHLDLQIWEQGAWCNEGLEMLFNTNVMSHVIDLLPPKSLYQLGINALFTVEKTEQYSAFEYLEKVAQQVTSTEYLTRDFSYIESRLPINEDIYISIDVDVLDSSLIRVTGYPSEMGIGLDHLMRSLFYLFQHNRVVGVDLVEFSPQVTDRSEGTILEAGKILCIIAFIVQMLGESLEIGQ